MHSLASNHRRAIETTTVLSQQIRAYRKIAGFVDDLTLAKIQRLTCRSFKISRKSLQISTLLYAWMVESLEVLNIVL